MNTRRHQISTLSIGDVARRTGLPTSALRFHEEKALIGSIRTSGNPRRCARDVIRQVSFVRAAQRVGLSLEQIRAVPDDLPAGRSPAREDWDRLATRWTRWLDERSAALERLRDKPSSCMGCGCLPLDTCALYSPDDAASRPGPGPRHLLGDSLPVTSPRADIHADAEQTFGEDCDLSGECLPPVGHPMPGQELEKAVLRRLGAPDHVVYDAQSSRPHALLPTRRVHLHGCTRRARGGGG